MASADILVIAASGHWTASVFHCPDKKGWPRGSCAGAQSLSVDGVFASEAAALEAAQAAMNSGRVRDVFVHGPTAKPFARYRLDQQQIDELGRLSTPETAERTGK